MNSDEIMFECYTQTGWIFANPARGKTRLKTPSIRFFVTAFFKKDQRFFALRFGHWQKVNRYFFSFFFCRLLTFCYLAALNCWLLLCPVTLSHDWQMGSVPLVASLADTRNIATCIFFGGCLLITYKAFTDFEVTIFYPISQFLFRFFSVYDFNSSNHITLKNKILKCSLTYGKFCQIVV